MSLCMLMDCDCTAVPLKTAHFTIASQLYVVSRLSVCDVNVTIRLVCAIPTTYDICSLLTRI